jgi:hypothetical protein
MEKICNKCNNNLNIKYFDFRKDTGKYRNTCKKCTKGYLTSREDIIKEIKDLLLLNLKKCSKCNNIKDLKEFNNDKQTITGKTSYCKKCIKNKYSPLELKNNSLKTKYKIDINEYNKLLIQQNNKCIICSKEVKNLVVDHCHSTLKVRGLLCNNCNTGLGMFEDNINNLQKAIEYLNRNK